MLFKKAGKNLGQALIEYILLLSILVGLSSLIFRTISSTFDRGLPLLGARMEAALKTGRTPNHLWREPEP